ncbi:MAG: hypothetical protein LAT62_00540 [Natronospirillum sp.]|uniref:hypothetical protein n=1 Tax=Natronospirillum sp. TaxID=2812955 RepID=UPI0025EB21B8|nr:hypothetical protein [Natronospirillum sp.]MCH8550389.1 hypothetical protein [Natronospirillum sp.]
MTIQERGKLVKLLDTCPVEEAETLHEKLLHKPDVKLDLSQCVHLHSAVLQVMLQQPRAIKGVPEDVFLREVVVPRLQIAWETAQASAGEHE